MTPLSKPVIAFPAASALVVCPVCQSSPVWYPAPRVTVKRGVICAFVTGCEHAAAVLPSSVLEASDAAGVVEKWTAEAARLGADVQAARARLLTRAEPSDQPAAPSDLSCFSCVSW